MAHGLSFSNVKWYVKNRATGAAELGPFPSEGAAETGLALRQSHVEPDVTLYIEEVDICKLAVHPQPIPDPR